MKPLAENMKAVSGRSALGTGSCGAGGAEVALVDPQGYIDDVMSSLSVLIAKVKHPVVRNALSSNMKAVVALVPRAMGCPQLFVAAMDAIAALCKEYPCEAVKSIPLRHSSKVDLETLLAAMALQATKCKDSDNKDIPDFFDEDIASSDRGADTSSSQVVRFVKLSTVNNFIPKVKFEERSKYILILIQLTGLPFAVCRDWLSR
jgi:hypothetical protein